MATNSGMAWGVLSKWQALIQRNMSTSLRMCRGLPLLLHTFHLLIRDLDVLYLNPLGLLEEESTRNHSLPPKEFIQQDLGLFGSLCTLQLKMWISSFHVTQAKICCIPNEPNAVKSLHHPMLFVHKNRPKSSEVQSHVAFACFCYQHSVGILGMSPRI